MLIEQDRERERNRKLKSTHDKSECISDRGRREFENLTREIFSPIFLSRDPSEILFSGSIDERERTYCRDCSDVWLTSASARRELVHRIRDDSGSRPEDARPPSVPRRLRNVAGFFPPAFVTRGCLCRLIAPHKIQR